MGHLSVLTIDILINKVILAGVFCTDQIRCLFVVVFLLDSINQG